MSFRRFVYLCALCGGWAAFVSWILGRLLASNEPLASAGIKTMCLGMLIALALGIVDALWNYSGRQLVRVLPRILTCMVIGTVGGLLGGVLGQVLFGLLPVSVFFISGWVITGLLVGASLGAFEMLLRFVQQEDLQGARRKVLRCILGGTLGGLLGGLLSLLLKGAWGALFHDQRVDELWSPSAMGFVALGLCIGLMIGLAQVLFKEGWVRVESGFRSGRELILTKPEITIGRAEACDIGLFGDHTVERLHARMVRQGNRYLLADAGSTGGTFVNDARIDGPTPLRSGDAIRVGGCVLRFGERQKRNPDER